MLASRALGLAGALLIFGAAVAVAQPPERRPGRGDWEGRLKVGDTAPLFTLADLTGKGTVSLADLKGKPVVLFFGSCT
jgi:cytochrome oxidase Cu insertion factor (SCO1/SenC/PrrC family)